ncbi:hypothetical protein IV203_031776 [Nitzschia inconspicua]|uniref:Uncharacterized protein n=1 Tax=Nitzschia inconspicua TaxID=303405 RepID=A0A9K3LVZ8_9STRA|nr:hypothetical protein IV203_031776 [Nitzschia inconspicua]
MPPHSDHTGGTTTATNYEDLIGSWLGSKRDMLNCANPNVALLPLENTQRFQCNQLQGSVPSIYKCTAYPSSALRLGKKERKRVSFFPQNNQVILIPSFRELTPDEFKALYLSKQEMGKIHEECWKLVDLMNSGIEYEDQEGFSKRGLVDLKDDSVERRRKMRDQAYRIVFGVQKFHSSKRRPTECMDVSEITASLYQKAAARAQEEAYEAAWFDAIAART